MKEVSQTLAIPLFNLNTKFEGETRWRRHYLYAEEYVLRIRKRKKKRAFKIRKRRYQLLPSLLLPPSFFFLPSTEKVEENISNSGGSHGRLGMRNSGFWKERKRKKDQAGFFFFFGYISFSCSFPTSLPDDLPLFLYYYYYYIYIF